MCDGLKSIFKIVDAIKHNVYFLPKNGNGYNYRFIEITNKPDSDYPLYVFAYQTGNIFFGECENEVEFYNTLTEIFKDARIKVVFEQLKNIGNVIERWNDEKE